MTACDLLTKVSDDIHLISIGPASSQCRLIDRIGSEFLEFENASLDLGAARSH